MGTSSINGGGPLPRLITGNDLSWYSAIQGHPCFEVTQFHHVSPPHLRGMDCFGPARFNVLPRLRGSSKNVRCRAKNTRSDPCPPKGDKINPTESIFQYLFEITSGYTTPVKKQRHHRSKVTLYGQATTAACQRAFPLWLGTASCRSPPGPACEWPDVQSPSIYGSKPRKILL